MNNSIDPTINSIIINGEIIEKEIKIFTEIIKKLIKETLENCGINGNTEINWEFKDLKIHSLTFRRQNELISVQAVPFIGNSLVFTRSLDEMDFNQILSVSDLLIKAKKQEIIPTITKN